MAARRRPMVATFRPRRASMPRKAVTSEPEAGRQAGRAGHAGRTSRTRPVRLPCRPCGCWRLWLAACRRRPIWGRWPGSRRVRGGWLRQPGQTTRGPVAPISWGGAEGRQNCSGRLDEEWCCYRRKRRSSGQRQATTYIVELTDCGLATSNPCEAPRNVFSGPAVLKDDGRPPHCMRFQEKSATDVPGTSEPFRRGRSSKPRRARRGRARSPRPSAVRESLFWIGLRESNHPQAVKSLLVTWYPFSEVVPP